MDPSVIAELDIEHLAARLSENPQSPLFARLADLYLSRERVTEAVALCEKGIELYPSYAGGHIVLGKSYEQLGAFTKARASYRRALELSPYNNVVHRLLVSLPEFVQDKIDASVPQPQAAPPVTVPPVAAPPVAAPAAPAESAATIEPKVVTPAPRVEELPPLPVPEPRADAAQVMDAGMQQVPAAVTPPPAPLPMPGADEEMSDSAPAEAVHGEVSPSINHDWFPINDPVPPEVLAEEAASPSFEPFPTFEQYIDLHPATEPTMTLEEYLKGRVSSPMSEPSTDFDSLAKKLQNAKRIVPKETAPPPMMTPDEPASAGQMIVSPTMAEIYVSQQEYAAAISVYQLLSSRHPAQAAMFGKRVAELQEMLRNKQP